MPAFFLGMKTVLILWTFFIYVPCLSLRAQYDSAYIDSYKGLLMPRFLLNRKTTGMNFRNLAEGYTLRYQPNKTFSAGLGITYKFATKA